MTDRPGPLAAGADHETAAETVAEEDRPVVTIPGTRPGLLITIGGPILALAVVALATLFARNGHKLPNPPALLFTIVAFSAFVGRVRSGLISAVIAWCYLAVSYANDDTDDRVVAFEWKIWQWYHTIVPYLPFAANQMFAVNPLRTFAAWLFDGAQGLFSVNPLFWLLLVGLPVWYYRNHRQLQHLFVIVCPTFFLFLTFDDWCGGYSPSGRYIITFAPLLLPAIGYLFSTVLRYNFLKIITVFLLIIQILLSYVYVHCQNDWTLSGQRSEIFLSIEKKTHLTLDYFMPHFTGYLELIYTNQICYVIFYFVLAAFLVYFGIRLFHRYSSAEHCLTVKPD